MIVLLYRILYFVHMFSCLIFFRWTWDTAIREILGSTFRLWDKERTDHVTLRDLLAHRVGIPSNFNALLVGLPENMSRTELIR